MKGRINKEELIKEKENVINVYEKKKSEKNE